MKKLAATLAILSVASCAQAKYVTKTYFDEMTDAKSVVSTDLNYFTQLSLRCDNSTSLMLSVESNDIVAHPDSFFRVKVRVDGNTPYDFDVRAYVNSWKDGYTRNPNLSLVSELMSGRTALVQVFNHRELKKQFKVKLSGTASSYANVLDACGVSIDSAGK